MFARISSLLMQPSVPVRKAQNGNGHLRFLMRCISPRSPRTRLASMHWSAPLAVGGCWVLFKILRPVSPVRQCWTTKQWVSVFALMYLRAQNFYDELHRNLDKAHLRSVPNGRVPSNFWRWCHTWKFVRTPSASMQWSALVKKRDNGRGLFCLLLWDLPCQ